MADANIKLRLDTKQAKGELRALNRAAEKSAGKVGQGLRSRVGRRLGGFATGAAGFAGGATVGALRGDVRSGTLDIAGAAMSPIAAFLRNKAFSGADIEAAATAQARAQIQVHHPTGPGDVMQFQFTQAKLIREGTNRRNIQLNPLFQTEAVRNAMGVGKVLQQDSFWRTMRTVFPWIPGGR